MRSFVHLRFLLKATQGRLAFQPVSDDVKDISYEYVGSIVYVNLRAFSYWNTFEKLTFGDVIDL